MPEEEMRGAASDKEEEEEEKKEDERKYGGDVAQLVERRTGAPLTQVRFPDAARESTFSADSSTVFVHLRVQSHASTSACTLTIL